MLLSNVLSSSLLVLSSVVSILLLSPSTQVVVSVMIFFSFRISFGSYLFSFFAETSLALGDHLNDVF